jgi:phosphoribosylglycinamide formyltransferase-1
MSPAPARLVVLASGRGSNLEALFDACAGSTLPAAIVAVLSDKPTAPALARATARGVAAEALAPEAFADRAAYDAALAARIDAHRPDYVALAGFMRILGADFVRHFLGRLVNIHPSLLPRHRGLHTHRRALEAGDREHGASVHFVTEELDGGPVFMRARVPVRPGDDEAALAKRVLAAEHRLYPAALGLLAAGRLEFRAGRVYKEGRALAAPLEFET